MKKNKTFEMFGFTFNVQDGEKGKIVAYNNMLIYRLHPLMWEWTCLQIKNYLLGQFEHFGLGKDYLVNFINEKKENKTV